MTRQILLASLLTFAVVLSVVSQTPTPTSAPTPQKNPPPSATPDDKDDVVKITTNLVQVDAVVTKDGRPIKDLKAEDFEIFEDGRQQQITSFAYVSNVPTTSTPAKSTDVAQEKNTPPIPVPLRIDDPHRTIALVVDDLGLSAESMGQVRRQLRKFVKEKLAPNDLVAIIRTGGQMGALQQFTNDPRVIERALSQVKWNVCSRVGLGVFTPIRSGPLGGSNDLQPGCGQFSFRATIEALRFIVTAMGELPGRKSMLVFSDSMPREEQEFDLGGLPGAEAVSTGPDTRNYSFLLQRIAERAIRSSVVIYAVDASGVQYTGLTAADDFQGGPREAANIMSSRSRLLITRREGGDLIARQTGGFLIRNSNDLGLNRILEDQGGYYLLGYRPTGETFNKRFHRIKARVKRSGMTLRTRFGFYGVSEEEANRSKRTPTDKTLVALMSPFGSQDIELDLTAFFANEPNAGSMVRSFVYLNAKDLTFSDEPDGWHKATIELRGIIFGNNGTIVDEVTLGRTLSLRGNTYEQALREGIKVQLDMPVKRPGTYQIRVAARDTTSSRIGAMGQSILIPDLTNHRLALSGIVMRAAEEAKQTNPGLNTGANPALRRFVSGSTLQFACVIYNSLTDATTHQPNLVMQARLFRDAKNVYTSSLLPIDVSNQPDPARIVAKGFVRLDAVLEPGNYYLQVVVTDTLAKEKQEPVVQWIDFEIVK